MIFLNWIYLSLVGEMVGKRVILGYDERYSEKMNALDLVINALKDHEEHLDELLCKLEAITKPATLKLRKSSSKFQKHLTTKKYVWRYAKSEKNLRKEA